MLTSIRVEIPANMATEMAEARRALTLEEEVLAHAPIAYHELDLEGRLVWVNTAECRLLGRTREDLLRRSAWELVSEEEQQESRLTTAGKLSSEQALAPFERTLMRGDGTTVVVEIHESYRRNE